MHDAGLITYLGDIQNEKIIINRFISDQCVRTS